MTIRIDTIDHFVLTVADVERTCEFYTRVLGFRVITFGAGRVALAFGNQKINLHPIENDVEFRAITPTPGSGDFCLLTEVPIDEVKYHVESCGVDILTGPVPRDGATGPIRSIYFRDPDGNLVEVANRVG